MLELHAGLTQTALRTGAVPVCVAAVTEQLVQMTQEVYYAEDTTEITDSATRGGCQDSDARSTLCWSWDLCLSPSPGSV